MRECGSSAAEPGAPSAIFLMTFMPAGTTIAPTLTPGNSMEESHIVFEQAGVLQHGADPALPSPHLDNAEDHHKRR